MKLWDITGLYFTGLDEKNPKPNLQKKNQPGDNCQCTCEITAGLLYSTLDKVHIHIFYFKLHL